LVTKGLDKDIQAGFLQLIKDNKKSTEEETWVKAILNTKSSIDTRAIPLLL
jgi:hypothetical protein